MGLARRCLLGILCVVAFTLGAQAAEDAARNPPETAAVPWESETALPARDGDITGLLHHYLVSSDETLINVAHQNGLGLLELMAANRGVDPWVPKDRTELILPLAFILPDAPREGIVINIAELRLYYFADDGQLRFTVPIGVGREGFETPNGPTKIVRKSDAPTWRPTADARRDDPTLPVEVPPGPQNPLGSYALYLGWPTYLIHGTNKPDGVGRRVSRGCIRLYPEDIERLYHLAEIGTKVTVVNQPVKFGWHANELFVEVHPTLDQLDQLETKGDFVPVRAAGNGEAARAKAAERAGDIDWSTLLWAEYERNGLPIQITRSKGEPVSIYAETGR